MEEEEAGQSQRGPKRKPTPKAKALGDALQYLDPPRVVLASAADVAARKAAIQSRPFGILTDEHFTINAYGQIVLGSRWEELIPFTDPPSAKTLDSVELVHEVATSATTDEIAELWQKVEEAQAEPKEGSQAEARSTSMPEQGNFPAAKAHPGHSRPWAASSSSTQAQRPIEPRMRVQLVERGASSGWSSLKYILQPDPPAQAPIPAKDKRYCWKRQREDEGNPTDSQKIRASCPVCGRKTYVKLGAYSASISRVVEVLKEGGHKVDGQGEPESSKTYGPGRWAPMSQPGMRLLEAIQRISRRGPADLVTTFQPRCAVPPNLTAHLHCPLDC